MDSCDRHCPGHHLAGLDYCVWGVDQGAGPGWGWRWGWGGRGEDEV